MRQFRIDPWVRDKIEQFRREHPSWTAVDIGRELERAQDRGNARIPVERTIRDYLKALAATDDELWEIDPDGDGRGDRAVLETLREATRRTSQIRITRRQARWIAYLAEVAPTLPPYLRLVAAWHVNSQRAAGQSLETLTAFLSWEPWADEDRFRTYRAHIASKVIAGAPGLLFVHAKRIANRYAERPPRRSNIAAVIEQSEWYKEQEQGDPNGTQE